MSNFDKAISIVLAHEGSTFSNTSGDNGGPTKYGITIPTYTDFDGLPHDEDDIRALTERKAKDIYLKQFWTPMCLQGLSDQRLATIILDQAVLCGKRTITKRLQELVGTMSDGIMGPQTIAACESMNTNNLIIDFLQVQMLSYNLLVEKNPDQIKFLKGWQTRVLSLYKLTFYTGETV